MQVLIYLGAIVTANLTINHFGPGATPYVAFILIGLDMTMRDRIHERWKKSLWTKMLVLIAVGSIISAAFGNGQIALASFLAFSLSGIADTFVYSLLKDRRKAVKVNTSNLVSALLDSAVFLTVAFGWLPWMILLQWGVKVVGGYVWFRLLNKHK